MLTAEDNIAVLRHKASMKPGPADHTLILVPVERPNQAPMQIWFCPACQQGWTRRALANRIKVKAQRCPNRKA